MQEVLALALGVSAMIWPQLTLALLVRLIGIYAVLDGAAGIIGSVRECDRQPYVLPAVVSVVGK